MQTHSPRRCARRTRGVLPILDNSNTLRSLVYIIQYILRGWFHIYNLKITEYPNGQTVIKYYKMGIRTNTSDDDDTDVPEISCLDVFDTVKSSDAIRSLNNSLNRSKNKIYDIARCNNWDIFCTFTFSSEYDRTDYEKLVDMLRNWLKNIRNRKCPNLKYLCVPEVHKRVESNGKHAYHFHALMSGIDNLTLTPSINAKSGKPLTTPRGSAIYNIANYKFGFSTATYVSDTKKVSNYITKYVTKDLCAINFSKRRYLASKNLELPKNTMLTINNIDDVMNYYAIGYEKTVHVSAPGYENEVIYITADKLDNDTTLDEIVNGLACL